MSTKSLNVKTFINDAGVHNQLFVFVGSDTTSALSDSTQTYTNLWNYSDFSVRVGQNSLSAVIPYIKWVQKKPYKPWSSNQTNNGNFYAYNDQNGYVYLCISDNSDNRTDHSGDNVSNYRPTHTSGIQYYSDGYAWKPMYKITPSIERFVTSSWMPVISFDNFDSTSQQNQLGLAQSFCVEYSTGETGQCAIYAKTALNTDDDSGTNEFERGDLFTIANNLSCAECYYLMVDNPKFKTVFYGTGETVPQTSTVYNSYENVGYLIQQNQITQASPYYYLYLINENDNIDEGSVISAFIDLSGFSTSQLVTSIENPEFTVTSNSGTGARIRLKTSMVNNQNVISGIEVIEPGSGYKDITLTMDESYIEITSSMLTSVVDVNLDTIDGLGFDPVDVLGCQHVMIDARVEKKTIEESGILLPTSLNFFGLIQNPSSTVSDNAITSGSNQNKKVDVIYRTTIKTKVTNPDEELPVIGDELEIPGSVIPSQDISTAFIKVGGTQVIGATTANVELKNLAYSKSDFLVGKTFADSITGNPTLTTISEVLAVPEFVQYTGKVLSSTKLNTSLDLSDVDSVSIRINMIKGM